MNQSGNTSCHAEPQYLKYSLLFQHSLSFCIYEKRFVPVKEQNVFIFSIMIILTTNASSSEEPD